MKVLRIILMALAFISLQAHAKDGRNLAVNQANNAVSEQRIALVIGNSAYTKSPLKNPVNDAKDVAKKLRGLGFDVIERNNLQTKQIGRTLSEFRAKLVPGAVALVFYAGHGLQIKGENYLPAVDAEITTEEDVSNQSLSVRQIMDVLDTAKTRLNLVFLDACRNNPYARSFRSAASDGLARISAPSGTLISYATRPGSVAADGGGRNGLYTSKLLAQMDSNLQIEQALKQVVTEVKAASQGKQEPWMEGSIEGDFCFSKCGISMASPVAIEPSSEVMELAYWDSIKDSKNFRDFDSYLEKFPNGKFADIGKARGGPWVLDSKGCKILFHGIKSMGLPDSLMWSGECLNGKANGHGTLEVVKGNIKLVTEDTYMDGVQTGSSTGKKYKGDKLMGTIDVTFGQVLDNGDSVSKGKLSLDGWAYEGQLLNGIPHGFGKEKQPDGSLYEGGWSNGKRNGLGKWTTSTNGNTIEGEWQDGKCVGKTKLSMPNGNFYVGEVSSDCKPHGYGVSTEKGKRFEGQWVAGQFMGR